MVGDEEVDQVHLLARHAVHLNDAPFLEEEAWLRVIGTIGNGEPNFRPLVDESILVDGSIIQCREPLGSSHHFPWLNRLAAGGRRLVSGGAMRPGTIVA